MRDKLQLTLTQAEDRIRSLEAQLGSAHRGLAEISAQHDERTQQLTALQQTAEEVATLEAEEIARLEGELRELRDEREGHEAAAKEAAARADAIDALLAVATAKNVDLEAKLKESREMMVAAHQLDIVKERNLTLELSKVAKECVELRKLNRTLTSTCEELGKSLIHNPMPLGVADAFSGVAGADGYPPLMLEMDSTPLQRSRAESAVSMDAPSIASLLSAESSYVNEEHLLSKRRIQERARLARETRASARRQRSRSFSFSGGTAAATAPLGVDSGASGLGTVDILAQYGLSPPPAMYGNGAYGFNGGL
mmetsp:Transcript_19849/g.60149  ORF Transcript_19849/g.60149 Transcript_19849/m.60149 type:complete len:310 (-) Transcript_19849:66-995(-)